MYPKRIPTIRSRLIMLVMACVIPASLMVVTLIGYNYMQDREQRAGIAVATARAMMSTVDMNLASVHSALSALATSQYLAFDDLPAFYEQAKAVLKTQNANNILLIDPTFQQRLNTLRPYGSALGSEAHHPQLTQVFTTGRPVTSDIMEGLIAKRPLIVIAVPVYRDGKVVYVLAATMFPEHLSELLMKQRLPADWIGVIVDSTGSIVARTHLMERFVGTKAAPALLALARNEPEGAIEIKTVEGIPLLSAFSRSAVSNWTVAIGIPLQSLTNELVKTLSWLVAGTVMLLATSLTAAWLIGSRIARSIHALVDPALALGSGQTVTVPPLQLREPDEVGRALTRASTMLIAAQHLANHDPLTGLANRALFEEILNHQLAICKRTKTTVAILCIDLDGFKLVNDVHGHAAGDHMLCTVATRLKNTIRISDLAARIGGDEFALILMHAGLGEAQKVAAKLIQNLSGPYPIGAVTLEISASVGIAVYPEAGTTSASLTRYADQAMYKAKVAGKQFCAA